MFRILDVCETREDGERFMKDHLEPIVEAMAVAAGESGDDFAPPTREGWDELHDSMAG